MIEKDLNRYSDQLRGYTELRLQENRNLDITLLNGNLVSNANTSSGGASARVFLNGSWGFASSAGLNNEAIRYAIKSALDNSSFLDSRQKLGQSGFSTVRTVSDVHLGTRKPRRTQREVVEFLRAVDDYILKSCRNLASRRIWFGALDVEKSVLTSGGGTAYSMIPRTRIVLYLSAEKNGAKADLSKILGGCGQFEDVFGDTAGVFREIDILREHLAKKIDAVAPVAGSHECILGPEVCGILAHEAVGHTAEADNVLAGGITKDFVGKQVASPLVSISDFANTAFGSVCPVPAYADDEGVKAEDVAIIENGVFKSYLHNRATASHFGAEPSGNARAAEFCDEPIIRMRNTAILPGRSRLQEMISSIDNGYYLLGTGNGQADVSSEFMFGIVVGYEIKNGKIGRAIKDTTVSGVAYDMLKTVSMVADDFSWLNGGMCSKLQRVPVGMGGASVKCRLSFGGR